MVDTSHQTLPLEQSLQYVFFLSPVLPETQTLESKHFRLQAFLFLHQKNLKR